MCFSVPGRIVKIDGNSVVIDYFGVQRNAFMDMEGLEEGDFVYAQGGFVVQKIDREDASFVLDGWRDTFAMLCRRDEMLALKNDIPRTKASKVSRILERAERGETPGAKDLVCLLMSDDSEEVEHILNTANRIRQKNHGNASCIHGIIEFSNYCKRDCTYCGINRNNIRLARYRLEKDEIIDIAVEAAEVFGFKAIVLQSGEDGYYTDDMLTEIIREIRKRCCVLIMLSIGERGADSYRSFYRAGARGALIRFESSNSSIYSRLHPATPDNTRIELIRLLRSTGYLISTGAMIGLPGQTEKDVVEDILVAYSLGTEMYSFGPLIPHPDTPLASDKVPDIDYFLKCIAVARIKDPGGSILVTTAVETLFGDEGLKKGLMSGGNAFMINVTPEKYRPFYNIYPGKAAQKRTLSKEIDDKRELLSSLGRT